jgi:hypothetical protein
MVIAHMRSFVFFALFSSVLVLACSGSTSSINGTGSGGDGGTSGGSSSVAPTCLDGAGKPAASCALMPTGNECSLGDANACTPLTKLEVYADDGKNGVCLHLVYDNTCGKEIFANTCIENTESGGKKGWQCWTSSVLPGFQIDLSQCHATGNYFNVVSTSAGQLDIDNQKCPAPAPG